MKKKMAVLLSAVMVLTMVTMNTTFCFAKESIVSQNTIPSKSVVCTLNGNEDITLFEQGPAWRYGGTRQANKFFVDMTAEALSLYLGGALKVPQKVINFIVPKMTDSHISDINVTFKETCYYREISAYQYEHDHIYEFYKNGKFIEQTRQVFYDTSLHGWK
ncbi:MAG: hypothetical protein RSB02_08330 [Anaerovoracaceae bacterium]